LHTLSETIFVFGYNSKHGACFIAVSIKVNQFIVEISEYKHTKL